MDYRHSTIYYSNQEDSQLGLDCVQGFWVKYFSSLHPILMSFFNKLLLGGGANLDPSLVRGRTVLILKNPSKGNTPDNYRPITCLSVVWKLLTSIIYQKINFHLRSNNLFPVEQKGCFCQSRGTKDQFLIDKLVMCDAKRKKNLCMAWIDFKKAFDSAPHDWIMKCLQLYGVNKQVQQFLFHSMHLWHTILTVNGDVYGEVLIQCGIFQGDSLSPLLFIMALMPLSLLLNKSGKGYLLQREHHRVSHLVYMDDIKLFASSRQRLDSLLTMLSLFSEDICMKFGYSKCNILTLTKGVITPADDDFTLPCVSEDIITGLLPTAVYRYLGVLESSAVHHSDMKEKLSDEYRHRVRKLLRSHLTGKNAIQAINSCAIPIMRYSAGIVDWT